ncbi:MAG: aminotransferase class I/II-fold pyridoxal phosphate-dependent enzyme, partial [Spirochaetaceae bacterium]|nr:aminotransferase class I/II-fold pyridoxal phosphate-dependent enzyme [Spirochaetaceae bacterium]
MSVFWNRRVKELMPYVPGEQPRDRKFIKLNTNENPYPPSPKVIEAIERVLSDEGPGRGDRLRLYPDPLCTEFREAAAAAYGVKPEQVFPGNGSDEVLGFAFGAFFESAEKNAAPNGTGETAPVLFPDVTYSFYPVYAQLWGVPYISVPLKDDFSIDSGDYCRACGGVVIPNPNAPTGRALPWETPAGIRPIVEYQARHNRVVIIDEAYAAFGAESAAPFTGRYANLLTVHTLSKSASLAGLRVGFAIGSEELIEGLFRIRDSFNSYTLDRLALAGGTAAVSDKAYYAEANGRVIATRERTAAALADMGFEIIPSRANFLFIRGIGPREKTETLSGEALFRALRDRGILVRHFNKPRIADYLRVSIG